MAADTPALCVASESAAIVLTVQDDWVFVFQEEQSTLF